MKLIIFKKNENGKKFLNRDIDYKFKENYLFLNLEKYKII